MIKYRKDIDGLRAIAVVAVILFHLGYMPNGYLGVDVFFTISGFLITKIVFKEAKESKFSIVQFYLRRIRRIIPLVLFVCFFALFIGVFVMLPDDLENLSQSVIATILFSNNILLLITTGNYWDVVNEYKPLMHTWSLGVEEQFYLIFPLIFVVLSGKKSKYIFSTLLLLTIVSMTYFFLSDNEAVKFYSIQYRFFELSLGGIAAILFDSKQIKFDFKSIALGILIIVLIFNVSLSNNIKIVITILASTLVLISTNDRYSFSEFLLESKPIGWIGKISFSLYMWHQIVLAYTRYFILEEVFWYHAIILVVVTFLLSAISYYGIEQPFRNKALVDNRKLLVSIIFVSGICFLGSFYLYSHSGIVRDVPELNLKKAEGFSSLDVSNGDANVHISYNSRIYEFDKGFKSNKKFKVLVIGNSFARDWSNVLLESNYRSDIELSYIYDATSVIDIQERFDHADLIFFSESKMSDINRLKENYKIEISKIWNVGTKNFGFNNGIFYNQPRNEAYCGQRTRIDKDISARNSELKSEWKERYIDLLGIVIDAEGKVPVFSYECKFISQDTRHLTQSGAMFYAKILESNGYMDIIFSLEE